MQRLHMHHKGVTSRTAARNLPSQALVAHSGTPVSHTQRREWACRVQARRRREWDFKEDSVVEEVVEEASASSHGLFNDSFKSALSEALSRQGPSSLLQGQEKLVDYDNIGDQEEVLKAALMSSKSTLMKLNAVKNEVEKAIENETRQVERLMFALEKARSDAAYYRSIGKMIDDGGQTD